MTSKPSQICNALTIDLEDWIQSVYDVDAPLTDCFIRNTHRVLNLLDICRTKATFFVLGLAAEKAPALIREIQRAGHEIQSHGYGHRLIHTQTPQEFRNDIRRSKAFLEDLTGRPITGYRAPAFSITRSTLWAVEELVAAGYQFDSSIFPMRMRRYGISGTPVVPYRLRTPGGAELLEIPVCTMKLGPLRLPAGGGGYFRTAPYWYSHAAIKRMNRDGHPAALYLHPYEFAPDEWPDLPERIPWRSRFQQGLGRASVAAKLSRLLGEIQFGTMSQVLANLTAPLQTLNFRPVDSCRTAARPVFNPA